MSGNFLVFAQKFGPGRIWAGVTRRYARWRSDGACFCVCCECNSPFFLAFRGGRAGFEQANVHLGIVGSDLQRYACPQCGANDRERHIALYIRALHLESVLSGARILHFAPEVWLREWLTRFEPAQYVLADLYPASASIRKVDMLNMQFPDGSFDVIIANHVLEHVGDDSRALAEIVRVLRPGGLALLQTPFSPQRETTFEDKNVQDPATRQQVYGQDDHVRLYGRDIISRFEQFGLRARFSSHAQILSDKDPAIYGVNPLEPFMLFERR